MRTSSPLGPGWPCGCDLLDLGLPSQLGSNSPGVPITGQGTHPVPAHTAHGKGLNEPRPSQTLVSSVSPLRPHGCPGKLGLYLISKPWPRPHRTRARPLEARDGLSRLSPLTDGHFSQPEFESDRTTQ